MEVTKYIYFVSFTWVKGGYNGAGDCELEFDKPVKNYDQILEMKTKVREVVRDVDVGIDFSNADITIVNFIQFKDE